MFYSGCSGIFPSPRVEQLINIDNSPAAGLWGAERPGSPFDVRVMGAIRLGQWKLITGNPGLYVLKKTHSNYTVISIIIMFAIFIHAFNKSEGIQSTIRK